MNSEILIFIGLVFAAAFLLFTGLGVPVFGENRKIKKRLKSRVDRISGENSNLERIIELRKDDLKGLSDFEKILEMHPALTSLRHFISQSGNSIHAYRLVVISILFAIVAGFSAWFFIHNFLVLIIVSLVSGSLPYIKIMTDRNERLARFEEQLPDAIDVMKRALQAGHPFNESLNLVGEELEDPVATEFAKTFAELNYGSDMKFALLGLLERVPSVNVMALITSVLVQRETGGNLTEILDKLSRVIRERFRFSRKVRTLSAEGRLSAWILCLVPFALIILIWFTTPDYLPVLLELPLGQRLLMFSALGMVVGIYWVRSIIRIEV